MKKVYKCLLLTLIGAGSLSCSINNNQFNSGIEESVIDRLNEKENIEKLDLKRSVIGNGENDCSSIFIQYGKDQDSRYLRFAVALKGNIDSIIFNRKMEGFTDKSLAVSTVYRGISANDQVYYYDGENVTTDLQSRGNYYWACYTMRFSTFEYDSNLISVGVDITSKDGIKNPDERTVSLKDIENKNSNSITTINAEEMSLFGQGSLNSKGYWGGATDNTYYEMTYEAESDMDNVAIGLDIANGNRQSGQMKLCQLNQTVKIFIDDEEVAINDDVCLTEISKVNWENFEKVLIGFSSLKKGTHKIRYQVLNLADYPMYNTSGHIAVHNLRSLSVMNVASLEVTGSKHVVSKGTLTAEQIQSLVNVSISFEDNVSYNVFASLLNYSELTLEDKSFKNAIISLKNNPSIIGNYLFTTETLTCTNIDLIVKDDRIYYVVEGDCSVASKESISFMNNKKEFMGEQQIVNVDGTHYSALIDVTNLALDHEETIEDNRVVICRDAPHLYIHGYPVDNLYGDIKFENNSTEHYTISSLVYNQKRYSLTTKTRIPYIVIEDLNSISYAKPNHINTQFAVTRTARLETEGNKLYYTLSGYCYGLEKDDISFDLCKRGSSTNELSSIEVITFENRIYNTYFELRAEISHLEATNYYPHLLWLNNSVDAVDGNSANYGTFIEFENKKFEIKKDYSMPVLGVSNL